MAFPIIVQAPFGAPWLRTADNGGTGSKLSFKQLARGRAKARSRSSTVRDACRLECLRHHLVRKDCNEGIRGAGKRHSWECGDAVVGWVRGSKRPQSYRQRVKGAGDETRHDGDTETGCGARAG